MPRARAMCSPMRTRSPGCGFPRSNHPCASAGFGHPANTRSVDVAPDDAESDVHINTLRVPPVYAITLRLGDVDALFDPLDEPGKSPWQCKGIQQPTSGAGVFVRTAGPTPKSRKITGAGLAALRQDSHAGRAKPPRRRHAGPSSRRCSREEVQNNLLCRCRFGTHQIRQDLQRRPAAQGASSR